MTFVVTLCDHKAWLWPSLVSLVSASNESMKWRRPIWVRTITFSHTQPPLIQKMLCDEHGAPSDILWCKNCYMTNTGPQLTSFDPRNVMCRTRGPNRYPLVQKTLRGKHTQGTNWPPLVQRTFRDEHGAPTDLLWCKKRFVTNTGPQPTF